LAPGFPEKILNWVFLCYACFQKGGYIMEGFGQRIIDSRERNGWTRRELAKRSGLHEQHLLKIEQGLRKRIEGDTLIRLARALGCSADYLLGLKEEKEIRVDSPASFESVA
jgi:transcriptional regulator with XRE-family HTH domain